MKKKLIFLPMAVAAIMFTFSACSGQVSAESVNIYEKTAIYTFITIVVLSLIFIAFGWSKKKDNGFSGNEKIFQAGAEYPISTEEITNYPVYVWDTRNSFYKIVFNSDGSLSRSSIIMTNGLDPNASEAGGWELSPDGKVLVTLTESGPRRIYTCVSKNDFASPLLMKRDSGEIEPWFIGPESLTNLQISLFGFSASQKQTLKFTKSFIHGLTVDWVSYPRIMVSASGEVALNPETTSGRIFFHNDGTLEKSIDNRGDATPDYSLSITGNWHVDETAGVLSTTICGFTTHASILAQYPEHCELLVSTTTGNKIWHYNTKGYGRI